jgi:class 3 adenylate cyclase
MRRGRTSGSKGISGSWSIRRSPSTGAGVVKNTGEGSLAEFASVVDDVRCAVEVQRGMTARELKKPEEH